MPQITWAHRPFRRRFSAEEIRRQPEFRAIMSPSSMHTTIATTANAGLNTQNNDSSKPLRSSSINVRYRSSSFGDTESKTYHGFSNPKPGTHHTVGFERHSNSATTRRSMREEMHLENTGKAHINTELEHKMVVLDRSDHKDGVIVRKGEDMGIAVCKTRLKSQQANGAKTKTEEKTLSKLICHKFVRNKNEPKPEMFEKGDRINQRIEKEKHRMNEIINGSFIGSLSNPNNEMALQTEVHNVKTTTPAAIIDKQQEVKTCEKETEKCDGDHELRHNRGHHKNSSQRKQNQTQKLFSLEDRHGKDTTGVERPKTTDGIGLNKPTDNKTVIQIFLNFMELPVEDTFVECPVPKRNTASVDKKPLVHHNKKTNRCEASTYNHIGNTEDIGVLSRDHACEEGEEPSKCLLDSVSAEPKENNIAHYPMPRTQSEAPPAVSDIIQDRKDFAKPDQIMDAPKTKKNRFRRHAKRIINAIRFKSNPDQEPTNQDDVVPNQPCDSQYKYDAKLEKSAVYLRSCSRTFTRASQFMKGPTKGLRQLNVHYSQTNSFHNGQIIFADLIKNAHVKNAVLAENVYSMERRLYNRRRDNSKSTTFYDRFTKHTNRVKQRPRSTPPRFGPPDGVPKTSARSVADKKRERRERIQRKEELRGLGYVPRMTTLETLGPEVIDDLLTSCRYLRIRPDKQPWLYEEGYDSQ